MKMIKELLVVYSQSFDPCFNLALEDWLFQKIELNQKILFLWRNRETVMLGRFQNPWIECNFTEMEKDDIYLARRKSGGGTVYHDLGNLNFSFISSQGECRKESHNEIILKALSKLGIPAQVNERNDLICEGKKFSGSAFKVSRDRAYHHGTLLINSDLERLKSYLTVKQKQIQTKALPSKRSQVTNLQNHAPFVTLEDVMSCLIDQYQDFYQLRLEDIQVYSEENVKDDLVLKQKWDFFKSWEWRYGETPQFRHDLEFSFEWSQIHVSFNVQKGVIRTADISSDSLHPQMMMSLSEKFKGIYYEKRSLVEGIMEMSKEFPMIQNYLKDLNAKLEKEVGC